MNNNLKNRLPGLGLITLFILLLAHGLPTLAAGSSFDHLSTGFPLTGAHVRQECQTCHINGVFKGTPRECERCHTQGSRIADTFKPANHVPTTLGCAQCHTSTATWLNARFSHTGIAPGSCTMCHNGATADGKPANHMITTASCDTCHRTTAWIPASFNHATVTPGTCATCHNGTTATGKPAGHVQTTASCDSCHRTSAWIPASFNHTGVTPGTCLTCHSADKPAAHIPTTVSCDQCHNTTTWTTSTFNHLATQGVNPGGCLTCHLGGYSNAPYNATARPSGHPTGTNSQGSNYSGSCDQAGCHNTTTFSK